MMMNKTLSAIALMVLVASCTQREQEENLKKEYIVTDGVYVEKVLPTEKDSNRYTMDNRIYTFNRTFIYDYYIIKKRDTLKFIFTESESDTDHQRAWEFIPIQELNPQKVETVSVKVLNGISNQHQTLVMYNYQFSIDPGFIPLSSTSGVIENKQNVWLHPHRDKYFMILELNPFPYIQKPYQIGTTWRWSLDIGDQWGDDRWLTWKGSINNQYEYKIVGQDEVKTKIGDLVCWVVQGTATSRIGSTGLVAYFHEEYGFVKLDYINIDKSKLIMEINAIN